MLRGKLVSVLRECFVPCRKEEEGPAPASGQNPTQKMWMLAYARICRHDMQKPKYET